MDDEKEHKLVEKKHGKVEFKEKFNPDKLAYILNNPDKYRPLMGDIDPQYDPFVLGNKYLKKSYDGVVSVSYFQPCARTLSNADETSATGKAGAMGVGRFYASGGLSMQGFKRGIRHAIGGEYYYDLDIVNAHPVILMQMCDRLGIECPLLIEYVHGRDKIMVDLAKRGGVKPGDIKVVVLTLINGGCNDYFALKKRCGSKFPRWLSRFKREATNILDEISELYATDYEAHAAKLKEKKSDKNPKASFNSLLMCNHENDILFAIIKFMKEMGKVKDDCVLCFDGCQLRRDMFPGGEKELIGLLPKCEAYITAETGFEVRLKIKPMNNGFPVPKDIPKYVPPLFSGIVFDVDDDVNVFRNDEGLAEIFARYAKQYVKCYDDDGNAFVWNPKTLLWEKKSYKHVRNMISPMLDKCMLWFEELYKQKKEHATDKKTIKYWTQQLIAIHKTHKKVLSNGGSISIYAKANSKLMDDNIAEVINKSPHELPTRGGGVVDMKLGVVRPRTQADLWSFELDVEFKGVNCNFAEVHKFVKPIFCFDDKLMDYMQKQIGTCATLELVRLLYVWYGAGRNGKSSLCKMMSSCLSRCTYGRGDVYGALSKEIFIKDPRALKGSKSQHTAHLMPLKGLRVGITSELTENERLDDDEVKRCTGGDDISVRALNKDQEFFTPLAKLVIPTNMKPTLDSSMQAIVDRMTYCPFNARFVSPDEDEKVDPENHKYMAVPEFAPDKIINHSMRDEFFTWMVVGAMKYYAEGLKPPQIVKDFKQKSLQESDRFAMFMAEEYEIDGYDKRYKYLKMTKLQKIEYRKKWAVSCNDLLSEYERYIEGEEGSRMSSIKIGRRLDAMKVLRDRTKHGRLFVGLRKVER